MQARTVLPHEEDKEKDPLAVARTRPLPSRPLQIFVLFFIVCVAFSILSVCAIRYFGIQSNITNNFTPSFQPCYTESNGLEKWIQPPLDLIHTMNDTELFWRATMVPRIKQYPFHRVPKIAFMFLTKGPLPLAPLWEKFLKGHEGRYSVYVHSIPSFHARFRPSSVFYKRQIPSQVAEWGRMSMCDAEKRLLANALLDISNERFILLSESCIPLYNFTTVYNYVTKSRHSFMGAFDDRGPFGRGRYNHNMGPLVNLTNWRKGSQWFELNRRLAISVVEDQKYYPKFKEFCRPACYVDEHYFPTMLTVEAAGLLANRSLTWVDWSRGGAHPATFGRADITEEFLRRIVGGRECTYNNKTIPVCFLFARKFAPSSLEPLLRLSRKVLSY